MHSDWSLHFLERIAVASEKQARLQAATRRDVRKLMTLIKRVAILLGLYGSGLLLLMLSEEKAKLAAELIKAMR